ncbi:MAG: fused MFS/spermidine synthase [Flavobacteriaceae bacterium]|nr:fused MFS/spermidine synthase [Flavobacteriaceae bacterium]
MKKILSYFWPFTKRFSSEINGTLEVTYINGKKVLDTENANYSYGSLQKILEFGLTKVDLKNVENLLLLGMGGGSIIHSLRNTFEYAENIVAVEIDPAVINLANKEFGITPSKKLQIIEEDAFQFVKNSNQKFQLIIIDLFIDTKVPPIFYGKEFSRNIDQITQSGGDIIFNVGFNFEKDNSAVQEITIHFGKNYNFRKFEKVNHTNTLLLCRKG